MVASQSTKRFFSRNEAAEVLGLSLPTISRRLADGSIPFTKLGGKVLIPAEAIERLVARAFNSEEE